MQISEIGGAAQEFRGDPPGGLREVVVREDAVGGNDGETVGSDSSFYRRGPASPEPCRRGV